MLWNCSETALYGCNYLIDIILIVIGSLGNWRTRSTRPYLEWSSTFTSKSSFIAFHHLTDKKGNYGDKMFFELMIRRDLTWPWHDWLTMLHHTIWSLTFWPGRNIRSRAWTKASPSWSASISAAIFPIEKWRSSIGCICSTNNAVQYSI